MLCRGVGLRFSTPRVTKTPVKIDKRAMPLSSTRGQNLSITEVKSVFVLHACFECPSSTGTGGGVIVSGMTPPDLLPSLNKASLEDSIMKPRPTECPTIEALKEFVLVSPALLDVGFSRCRNDYRRQRLARPPNSFVGARSSHASNRSTVVSGASRSSRRCHLASRQPHSYVMSMSIQSFASQPCSNPP